MDLQFGSKTSLDFNVNSWYKHPYKATIVLETLVDHFRLVVEACSLNVFTRIGTWVEKHFPEKMTAMEVNEQINQLQSVLNQHWNMIVDDRKIYDAKILKLEADLNILKTQTVVKSRIVGTSLDPMTPFASRPKAVQPTLLNGGNQ